MSEALTPLLTPDPYAIPLEEYDMIRQDIFHHDHHVGFCLLYKYDDSDVSLIVNLGGRRILKKKHIRNTKYYNNIEHPTTSTVDNNS